MVGKLMLLQVNSPLVAEESEVVVLLSNIVTDILSCK